MLARAQAKKGEQFCSTPVCVSCQELRKRPNKLVCNLDARDTSTCPRATLVMLQNSSHLLQLSSSFSSDSNDNSFVDVAADFDFAFLLGLTGSAFGLLVRGLNIILSSSCAGRFSNSETKRNTFNYTINQQQYYNLQTTKSFKSLRLENPGLQLTELAKVPN